MEEAKTYLVVFLSNGEMRCTCLVYTPAQLQTFIASVNRFSNTEVMIFEVGPCIYTTVEDTLL
jgi:hypothetical protein